MSVPRTRTFSDLVAPAFPYAQPESVGLSSERLAWIGDEIVAWISNGELVGGELLIVKDGRAVLHEAYGWSDRERRIPVRRNSIWSIKSMSKPFAATAALMLAEEGKLSLDESVSLYVPGFKHKDVTIHHLLSHTSGFIHDDDWYDQRRPGASLEEMVESWPHGDPEAPLGEFHYADFNYAVLGYIISKSSGMPVEDFIAKRIVQPLGLDDTTARFSNDPVWRSRLNPWYRWNEQAGSYDLQYDAEIPGWTMYPVSWGLLSTAMDYARFMTLWMRKGAWGETRLMSEASVELALAPHGDDGDNFAYGYGWYLDRVDYVNLPPFAHSGGDGTQAGAYPDDSAIVIFMTHGRWGPWFDGFWNRVDMSGVLGRRPGFGMHTFMVPASEAKVVELERATEGGADVVGTYVVAETASSDRELKLLLDGLPVARENLPPPLAIEIWEERGRLHVRRGKLGLLSAERFHLVPVGPDRFLIGRYSGEILAAVEPDSEIRIYRDDSGNPIRLDIVWRGAIEHSAERVRRASHEPR